MTTFGLRLATLLVAVVVAAPARAALVSWNVDSSASYVRLTIPDAGIVLDVVGTTIARVRNQGATTFWSDEGGRRATLEGTIQTDVTGGLAPTAISFLPGGNTIQALDDKSLRPDPNVWNGTEFTAPSTSHAALGGKIRGTVQTFINFDAAYFSMSQLGFNITGGGELIANGLPAGSTNFAATSGLLAVDGQPLSFANFELGNSLGPLPALGGVNHGAVALQDLGGDEWQMTYAINLPISLQIAALGLTLNGNAVGQIVATSTLVVPEPSSMCIAGLGVLGLAWLGRRRLRR